MPPLISFHSINECTIYLKALPVGSQCILTGGPVSSVNSREQFLRRGLVVKLEGLHGNRTVTHGGIDDRKVEKYKDWRRAKNKDGNSISFEEAGGDELEPGESVFLNGDHSEVIESLRNVYGAGNYSCSTAEDPKFGIGWIVKHLTEEERRAREELKRIQAEKRIQRAEKSIEEFNNPRITSAKALGAGIDVGQSVFVQSHRKKIRDHLSLRFKSHSFVIEAATHETLGECFKVTRTA